MPVVWTPLPLVAAIGKWRSKLRVTLERKFSAARLSSPQPGPVFVTEAGRRLSLLGPFAVLKCRFCCQVIKNTVPLWPIFYLLVRRGAFWCCAVPLLPSAIASLSSRYKFPLLFQTIAIDSVPPLDFLEPLLKPSCLAGLHFHKALGDCNPSAAPRYFAGITQRACSFRRALCVPCAQQLHFPSSSSEVMLLLKAHSLHLGLLSPKPSLASQPGSLFLDLWSQPASLQTRQGFSLPCNASLPSLLCWPPLCCCSTKGAPGTFLL